MVRACVCTDVDVVCMCPGKMNTSSEDGNKFQLLALVIKTHGSDTHMPANLTSILVQGK